jgi:hypothetical protein
MEIPDLPTFRLKGAQQEDVARFRRAMRWI